MQPDTSRLPSWAPDERPLGDLELLLSGALAPLTGFMGSADVAALAERGTLADGTPWPAPITLDVPAQAVPDEADGLILQDPEGAPLAMIRITERTGLGVPATAGAAGGGAGAAGGRARAVPAATQEPSRDPGRAAGRSGARLRHPDPAARAPDRAA